MPTPDLTDPGQVQEVLSRLFSDPTLLPPEFKSWLQGYSTVNPPDLIFDQLTGFSDYQIKNIRVDPEVSTGSTTYISLGGGPVLDNLPPGKYLVTFAATGHGTASQRMALRIDGVMPDDATPQCVRWDSSSDEAHGGQAVADVKKTVELVYRTPVSGATVFFSARSLTAQRISQ